MKSNSFIILISGLVVLILLGCTKKCDDFNYDIINWMPYNSSEKILISNSNIIDTMKVMNVAISLTDKTRRFIGCGCWDFYSLNMGSSLFKVTFLCTSRSIESADIDINNENLNFSEQLDNFVLNGKQYSDVVIFKNYFSDNSKRFDRVVIAKSIGIIAIFGINEQWFIVNDSKKDFEGFNGRIEISDC